MIHEFDVGQRAANANQRKKGQPAREGLRTTREMAAEFGVTLEQLTGYMATAKIPIPEVELRHRSKTANGYEQRSFYKPSQMRAWWKADQAARDDRSSP